MQINDIKTPCFVLELDKLYNNIDSFQTALDNRFPINVLGYSVKTNSTPALLKEIKKKGCYAEVVSYHEYQLAIALGFQPTQIIYNGPLKSQETFLHAIINGAYVNIDSKRELEWLKILPQGADYSVGLRINLNLQEISPEDCKVQEDYSRFGFSTENGEFEDAISYIKYLGNTRIKGLHLHRTSKTRSLSVYSNICQYALKVIQRYNLELGYIDIGGGFYGDMPGKPTYSDYVNVIADTLSAQLDISKICLIVEPGNALIASPFTFYSSVIDTKDIGKNRIVVLDGSRNDIDPFYHKNDYYKEFISKSANRRIVPMQTYVGCTCLENDKLFCTENAIESKVGDMIRFSFVGAYTTCLSPLFIRYFPRVYIQSGEQFKLAREEWNEKDYLQQNSIKKCD